jgi:hypothetical protein
VRRLLEQALGWSAWEDGDEVDEEIDYVVDEQKSREVRASRTKIPEKAAAILAGENRYSTGKPCKHGHIAERRVYSGVCVECERLQLERLIAKHPKKVASIVR